MSYRAILCQQLGALKTDASRKPIPISAGFSALLLDWQRRCPYNQDSDYVFGSPEKHGLNRRGLPVRCRNTSGPLQSGQESRSTFAGTYSDTFATLLQGNDEHVNTVQESLMRTTESRWTGIPRGLWQ